VTRGRVVLAVVVLMGLLAVGVVVGVRQLSTSPQERYCDEVLARRAELTTVLSTDGGDGLLRALPILADLRERAPADIRDEWRVLVRALEGLRDALEAAGADPATYDRDDPPQGVSAAERDRIDAAALVVGSSATSQALSGLDQHARDVCGTPLTQ
jgi:hypothetical protein